MTHTCVAGCLVSRVPDRIPSLNYVCPRRCLPISARRWQVPLTSKVPLAHSHSQRPRGRRRLSRLGLAGAEHRRSSSCPLAAAVSPPSTAACRTSTSYLLMNVWPDSLLLTRCSRRRRCCSPSARPSSPSSRDTCRWGTCITSGRRSGSRSSSAASSTRALRSRVMCDAAAASTSTLVDQQGGQLHSKSACASSNEDARPRASASHSLTKPRASLPAKEKRRSRAKDVRSIRATRSRSTRLASLPQY